METDTSHVGQAAAPVSSAAVHGPGLMPAYPIIAVIVNDTDKAIQALKEHEFTVRLSEVIAVAIPDIPGALGN